MGGEMTRSGDLLGACTPKGTATYPANHAWTAAYPANHVGLAPSLPGSSLPGKSWASHEPTRQTAYPAITRPTRQTAPTPIPDRGPTRQITTRVWRLPRAGRTRQSRRPGGPTRQITRPTRQVRISEGVLGQACKTCLTVGSEHGEASGLC